METMNERREESSAKPVVVFGSTSGIAHAVCLELLKRGRPLILCARNEEALARQARDFSVRFNVKIPTMAWDILDMEKHQERAEELLGRHSIGGIFMAVGVMPDQRESETDYAKTLLTYQTNLGGVAVVLNLFAAYFKSKRSGFISCLSSVAGDRGRKSNYIYGSSKAGLSAYLQGLRHDLAVHGVLVQTIKPGIVNTAMTAHLSSSVLAAEPQTVARDIVRALEKRTETLYTPSFWRPIMWVIRSLPEFLFKRIKL